ncbi:hypothetical protein [Spiroplasma ixodetis]|nr:hypothetical protein [Spiroplasma ixodetis]
MNSFNFIVSSTSTCGEKSEILIYLINITKIFLILILKFNY